MRRTQIYLDERHQAKLRATARATRRTISEVIREAIDDKLSRPSDADALTVRSLQRLGSGLGVRTSSRLTNMCVELVVTVVEPPFLDHRL